ncbi:inosine-uridine preferring nucleoside hydrolase [Latimeria chalumnae]|nr:PREDICTED: inosine-uridine preferring nucleoside hydrolase-like [Latimeria chalumnae]XP_005995905.1 PREDICTED: inosine-uridine preferring nucleoside hydrolase-like [Latimeria chalumnae]XP_014343823.1 PREDICTED: inosine-uridine preferring nucleoside hydrolase-like [Latimeria chalumnae]|eukprot:XP_005995904.1 PREDICTED: inosine-uridine preferring nucleoside hydrolase-like [Latimeria chalumnae]
MSKKLLLIDVDCGVDDAQAIMVALAAPGAEILGITCCFGNTTLENVCKNVLQVLTVCNRTKIPVFSGASVSLLGEPAPVCTHFGQDGLGGKADADATILNLLEKEHAVNALIRIATEHAGEVSLVATGPLTNLALAVRMDPTLPQKLKNLYIMGGNMEGKGNRAICAEFNFVVDPEAAYIVLEDFTCPTYIATWDFVCRNQLPWGFFDQLVKQDTKKAEFIKKIISDCPAFSREEQLSAKDVNFGPGFASYDSYAMAAALDESFVTEYLECEATVELSGKLTRGMMVLDLTHRLKKKGKVFLMKECNIENFKKLLMAALQ